MAQKISGMSTQGNASKSWNRRGLSGGMVVGCGIFVPVTRTTAARQRLFHTIGPSRARSSGSTDIDRNGHPVGALPRGFIASRLPAADELQVPTRAMSCLLFANHRNGRPHSPARCPAMMRRSTTDRPAARTAFNTCTTACPWPRRFGHFLINACPSRNRSASTPRLSARATCADSPTSRATPARRVACSTCRCCVSSHLPCASSGSYSRVQILPWPASHAASRKVPSTTAGGSPSPASAASTGSRPSRDTVTTACRPCGTCPGGYSAKHTLCVRQRRTHNGWHGPVFRGRSHFFPMRQGAGPTLAHAQVVGISGTGRFDPSSRYGVDTNRRRARRGPVGQNVNVGNFVLDTGTRSVRTSGPRSARTVGFSLSGPCAQPHANSYTADHPTASEPEPRRPARRRGARTVADASAVLPTPATKLWEAVRLAKRQSGPAYVPQKRRAGSQCRSERN